MWIRFDDADLALLRDQLKKRQASYIESQVEYTGIQTMLDRLDKVEAETANNGALVETARELYAFGSDDDIEVDDDAALSQSDEGTWVMMWGWIRNEDEDEE